MLMGNEDGFSMNLTEQILLITGLLGGVAMAASGALVAIERQLDLLGVVLLGVITTVGGGILRDTLLGELPPRVFKDPLTMMYVLLATVVSLILFFIAYFFQPFVTKRKQWLLQITNVFDAIGLGAFTVVGAETALSSPYADNAFLVISVGVLTGSGGGILRDMMAGQVPVVLRKRIYIVASVMGAVLYYSFKYTALPDAVSMLASMSIVVLIRLLATFFRWNLPKVILNSESTGE